MNLVKIKSFNEILEGHIQNCGNNQFDFRQFIWTLFVDRYKVFANPYYLKKLMQLRKHSFTLDKYPIRYLELLKEYNIDKNVKIGGKPLIWNIKLVNDLKNENFALESMISYAEQSSPFIKVISIPEFSNIFFIIISSIRISKNLGYCIAKITYSCSIIYSKIISFNVLESYLLNLEVKDRTTLSLQKSSNYNGERIIQDFLKDYSKAENLPLKEINKIDTVCWLLVRIDFKQNPDPFIFEELMNRLGLHFNINNLPIKYIEILRKFSSSQQNNQLLVKELHKEGFDLNSRYEFIELGIPNIQRIDADPVFGDDRLFLISDKVLDRTLAYCIAKCAYEIFNTIQLKLYYPSFLKDPRYFSFFDSD